jgi:hypothetical protein
MARNADTTDRIYANLKTNQSSRLAERFVSLICGTLEFAVFGPQLEVFDQGNRTTGTNVPAEKPKLGGVV